jgi:hypothetical protein
MFLSVELDLQVCTKSRDSFEVKAALQINANFGLNTKDKRKGM